MGFAGRQKKKVVMGKNAKTDIQNQTLQKFLFFVGLKYGRCFPLRSSIIWNEYRCYIATNLREQINHSMWNFLLKKKLFISIIQRTLWNIPKEELKLRFLHIYHAKSVLTPFGFDHCNISKVAEPFEPWPRLYWS